MANRTASPPSLPPDAIEAITSKAPDAPRRCFICLTDEDPSDPPNTWVDPCPCTLEAHQDCMLSWVVDCERSNKPLRCPVCKNDIKLEGPWDPVVALYDYIGGRFTKSSPWVLFTGAALGVTGGLQMYGVWAVATFAGREALLQLMLGDDRVVDITQPTGFSGERLRNGLALMQVAPVLLLHRFFPSFVDILYSPQVFLYGVYHFKTDPNFLRWPPSPALAITAFPIVRRAYYNFYNEFILPREVRLTRTLMGLPEVEPRRDNAQNRNGQRNGEGGVIGFLQSIIDALDPDDGEGQGQGGEVVLDVEVVIEEEAEVEDEDQQGGDAPARDDRGDAPEIVPDVQLNVEEADEHQAEQNQPGGAQNEVPENQAPGNNHEAPPPPAHRPGLGVILHSLSNGLVSALALPGICFTVGEILRLTLPVNRQAGLLRQQWGRSLVGGCLYVVIRDAARLYAKHRKVQALQNRKVKNVERERRRNQG